MELFAIFRAIAALTLVLAMIWGGMWLLRRYGGKFISTPVQPKEKQLQVLETLTLQPRYKVMRVRNGASEHVILLSPDGNLELSAGNPLHTKSEPS